MNKNTRIWQEVGQQPVDIPTPDRWLAHLILPVISQGINTSVRHPADGLDFALTSSAYRPATSLCNHRLFLRIVPFVVGRIYRSIGLVCVVNISSSVWPVSLFAVYPTAGINHISAT